MSAVAGRLSVLKTKTFNRWARKERLADPALLAAVEEMRRGLVDADLGSGLMKKRVARPGSGKSGGFRTLLATDLGERWVFIYGFANKEREDVDDDELSTLKRLAQAYLGMTGETIQRLLEAGELVEVKRGEPQAA